MANPHEQSDQQAEAQLEQLLKSGYASSEPSAEFQEALLRQLDQTFVRTYPATTTPTLPLANPSALNGLPSLDDAVDGVQHPSGESVTVAIDRVAAPPRRRITLRLAMTMAVAASLLFSVALWNTQSAYGWVAMLRALENCGWVQAVSETAGLSGWASSQRGVIAIRSDEKVAFLDQSERTASQYLSDRRVIYRQALPANTASLGPEGLFGLLLSNDSTSSPAPEQSRSELQLISESWRRVAPQGDQKEVIELRVALRSSGAQQKIHQLVVLLDPETKLPISCRLLDNGRGSAQIAAKSLEFTYPAEGPSSIFALGIPRETKVIVSLANLGTKKLDAAREGEAGRLLSRADKQSAEREAARLAAKPVSKIPETSAADQKNTNANKKEKQAEAEKEILVAKSVQADEIVTLPPASEPTSPLAEKRVASNPPRPVRELAALALPEEPLAPAALVEQVNLALSASWDAQGITPAERANDTEFLRRVYLDLTGRIPIVAEVYEFLEDNRPDRRELLVDQLLASRDHATHLATVWRTLLLPDGVDMNTYGGTGKFDQWLADRFEKNLPYDQLVRELLLAEGRVSGSGPILFYAALKLNPEELAAKTARTFLGMRMECAQCHDHPFDESISQEDFWGFAAHFAQISRPRGKMEMTSSVLRVRDNKRGEVMLPDSEDVVPPHLPYIVQQESKADPSRSRREALVDWLTTKQNSRFARATVNRVWQQLFGLGLVEPTDDMRADNLPACPEALETLSLDFAASGYDLRRLLRTLVLSDAYQLSSRSATDEPSQGLVFARMNIKSFTADQLYDCINVATEPETMGRGNAADGSLARINNTSRQAFVEQFRAPPGQRTDYHAGIPQALTLMHGYLVHGATDLASSGLLKSLNAPFMNDEQRIETLFLATLSRFPDQAERETMLSHVETASTDAGRSRALGDILWALLNSAEFTFIH